MLNLKMHMDAVRVLLQQGLVDFVTELVTAQSNGNSNGNSNGRVRLPLQGHSLHDASTSELTRVLDALAPVIEEVTEINLIGCQLEDERFTRELLPLFR